MFVLQRSSCVVLSGGLSCCRRAELPEGQMGESDAGEPRDVERQNPRQNEGAPLASAFLLCVALNWAAGLPLRSCQTLTGCRGRAAAGRSSEGRWRSICVRAGCTRTASPGASPWRTKTPSCSGVTFSPPAGHQTRALRPSHLQTVQDITK